MSDQTREPPDTYSDRADGDGAAHWIIPYINQPLDFWRRIVELHPDKIREVYFPLPAEVIGSGEPTQPSDYHEELLRSGLLKMSALLNAITLSRPVEETAPRVLEELRRLRGEYGVASATVTNLTLARYVREALPDMTLTASCLMQIQKPNQVAMLDGLFDNLVPPPQIMRDLPALKTLKEAFRGRIRLLVNECCLPGCPFRVQHFHEMGCDLAHPLSLCADLLDRHPWMRLTGAWVLPQHLHLYEGVYDDLKLGGRVTLRMPEKYLHVLDAYIHRKTLPVDGIGGGPASMLMPLPISEVFFKKTLYCRRNCHVCTTCREYFKAAAQELLEHQGAR